MNNLFESYNNIEENIQFFELNQTLINSPELKKIIFLFRRCKNILLERNDFKIWHQGILNPISEYLFTITNSPLPFNYEKFRIRNINLEEILNKSDQLENNVIDNLVNLIRYIKLLNNLDSNNLDHYFKNDNFNIEKDYIVVPNIKIWKETKNFLINEAYIQTNYWNTDLKIIYPRMLDDLIDIEGNFKLFGSLYNYDEKLILLPEVKKIECISYDFFFNFSSIKSVFSEIEKIDENIIDINETSKVNINLGIQVGEIIQDENETFNNPINPSDLNNSDFFEKIEKEFSKPTLDNQIVTSSCLNISNSRIIYLNQSSKQMIVRPKEKLVQDIDVEKIIPGDYVLLRTKHDKDYLNDMVDYLLGENKEDYKNSLANWKLDLKNKSYEFGIDYVEKKLIDLGSKIANKPNIINWYSDYSYGPISEEEFLFITKLIGFSEREFIRNWNIIKQLRTASITAGKEIIKQLKYQIKIKNLDYSKLLEEYKFNFEGLEYEYTAYLVEDKKEKININENYLNTLISSDFIEV